MTALAHRLGIPEDIAARLAKYLPVLPGIALAWFICSVLVLAMPAPRQPSSLRQADKPDSGRALDRIIIDKNVLGLDSPASGEKNSASIGITLVGTVSGDKPAALVQSDGKISLFFPGEEVSGWKLKEVRPVSAIWERGRETAETMLIESSQLSYSTPAPAANTSSQAAFRIPRKDYDELIRDPNNILKQVVIKPSVKEGKTEGYLFSRIKTGSLFDRLGIKNEDLLVSINGDRVDGPDKLLHVFAGLKTSGYVALEIIRQGKPVTLGLAPE